MSADLGDISLYSAGRGGGGAGDGEDGERRPSRPEYSGPRHENVKQKLNALREDSRFSNVDATILRQIIDGAIQTAEAIGSQRVENVIRGTAATIGSATLTAGMFGLGMFLPPFMVTVAPMAIATLGYMLGGASTDQRTKAKSQLFEEVVKRLEEFNRMPITEQRRLFAGMERQSTMRNILPAVAAPAPTVSPSTGERQASMRDLLFNATRRGAGYQRVGASDEDGAPAAAGAGAGTGLTYADMRNAPTVPDSVRDRVLQMLKEKKEFPPMRAGERKKDE
jgi:hypothetical protein